MEEFDNLGKNHLMLKAENILVDCDDKIKIAEYGLFGLDQLYYSKKNIRIINSYMSPE